MKKKGSTRPSEFKRLLKISPPFKQRLYFVGILTKYLKDKGIKPIVVGGNAVEFYTLGTYASSDIDLVSPGYATIDKLLKSWGFKKIGRHWLLLEIDLEVEIPASSLGEDEESKILEVEVEGLKVYLIGIEDLIIDRLNAYVHWESIEDGEWAEQLIKVHFAKIDWSYLENHALKQETLKALKKIKKNCLK